MIGARLAMWGGKWKNPYQTEDDALIAHIDPTLVKGTARVVDDVVILEDIISGNTISLPTGSYISTEGHAIQSTGSSTKITVGTIAIGNTCEMVARCIGTPYSNVDMGVWCPNGCIAIGRGDMGHVRLVLYYSNGTQGSNNTINTPTSYSTTRSVWSVDCGYRDETDAAIRRNGTSLTIGYDYYRYTDSRRKELNTSNSTTNSLEICAIRIYNRKLTDDELAHNLANDVSRFGITL